MPTYTINCPCGYQGDLRMTFGEYRQSITQPTVPCPDCQATGYTLGFSRPGNLGFILKEGDTGGWASKGIKENKWRATHNQEISRRQKEHAAPPTRLIPNYQGQEADRWSDVQDHVHTTKGKEAASTYNALVFKEKGESPCPVK